MRRILNPLYDVVFKHFFENLDVARLFLSKILGTEILELSLEPQEMSHRKQKIGEVPDEDIPLRYTLLRLDFAATIKEKNHEPRKVIIELQRGKAAADILRFRKYLGGQYKKTTVVRADEVYVNEELLAEEQKLFYQALYRSSMPEDIEFLMEVEDDVRRQLANSIRKAVFLERKIQEHKKQLRQNKRLRKKPDNTKQRASHAEE